MYKKKISVLKSLIIKPKINPSPILILGNQKTGTSAIAHLLADYGGLSKTVDIPEIWWPTLKDLLTGKVCLTNFAKKYPHRFATQVIKEPGLTFFFNKLVDLHPYASFLFVVRDPRVNIRSLLNRMSIPGNLEKLDIEKCKIEKSWKPIFDSQIWNLGNYTHYIDILAARWNRTSDVYLKHTNDMILIRYEDFIADKVGTIESLASKLHIKQKHEISEKVNIQYQPRGQREISFIDFFGKKNLSRIEDICGRQMKKFDYLINAN